MPINIIGLDNPPTPQEMTLDAISAEITKTGRAMLESYNRLRQLCGYTPSGTNQFGLTVADVFSCIDYERPLGMTGNDFGAMAKVTKGVLNYFQPGVVVDEVPAATITLPPAE